MTYETCGLDYHCYNRL